MNCLKDKLVRHEMGADEGEDPETARYKALQKQNEICVGHLGNLGFKSTLLEAKLVEKEESVRAQLTVPYSEERILAIKSASSHGARFKATGGFTISGNEFFKAATLRNNEEEAKVVQADKKKRQECEKNENAALAILQNGQAIDNLKKAELEVLFAWHGIPKNEQGTNMKERTSKWRAIVASKKEAPSYQKWTDEEEQKLKNLHNVDVPMKDTAVGRLQALRRREAKLSLKTMTPEERKTFMDNIDSDSES